MSLWEYKVITSGKGGFATPAHLDKFLNDLGRDEWEIIEFRTAPDNALAFNGLARRSTQRDWTLQDAAAAAAKAEAEKLRAEFAAKFQAATAPAPVAEEKAPSFLEEKTAPDDGFRKPVDTSRDSDPDAPEEEASEKGEWENLDSEDELPSFFDALKPHMRRNQRGPGMSVGTDYLAKKWGLAEEDIKGALVECGLQIPADENAKPAYAEYDGDLFWVNINRRGEVWINTREKPRPVFRVVQAQRLAPEASEELMPEQAAPRSDDGGPRAEAPRRQRSEPAAAPAEPAALAQPEIQHPKPGTSGGGTAALPPGSALLARIRPLMRRNRRGPGGSGSATFLARALKCTEADLVTGFAALGLILPPAPTDKPIEVEIEGAIWWLNQDSRGGLWINGREKREGDAPKPDSEAPAAPADSAAESSTAAQPAPGSETPLEAAPAPAAIAATAPSSEAPSVSVESLATSPESTAPVAAGEAAPVMATAGSEPTPVLAAVRLWLQETKTGSFAGKVERVAGDLGKSPEALTAALTGAGLRLPEKPRERPVFVEHAGEIFWFNVNPKGELWVNAKPSKFADKADESEAEAAKRLPRRGGRGRGPKSDSGAPEAELPMGDPAPPTDTPSAVDPV